MSKRSLHLSLFMSSVFEVSVDDDTDNMGVEMATAPKFVPATHYVATAVDNAETEARVATYLALKVLHRWMGEQLEDMGEKLGELGGETRVNMPEPEGGAKA